MKYKIFVGLVMLVSCVKTINAATLDEAKNAYFHRDYQRVQEIVNSFETTATQNKTLQAELKLLSIAVAIHNDDDDAGDNLEDLLEANPNNAYLHYFASILWYRHVENVSVFSKISTIKNHVKAMIKAAKLEPDNDRYQYLAASAYGQPSMFGGDSDKQKPIVDLLNQKPDSMFAPMATMDYLQNTVNKEDGFAFIDAVSEKFKTNIEVLERAGQLLWTFEKKQQAGELFTAVCNLPPGEFEAYVKWSGACLLTAIFASDGTLKNDTGLTAVERLIKYTKVDDEDAQYALSLRKELLNKLKGGY